MPKPDGLLAILAEGKEKGSGSKGSEPGSATARALKAMWSAMQSGNFDAAAEEFETAYEACASGGEKPELDDDSGDEDDDEDY